MKTLTTSIALCALIIASGTVQAALESRLGGQAIYDTDLNVTWLADANLAATNTFGAPSINPNGSMDWYTAQIWIGGMNAANYLGYHDWRLPTSGTCPGGYNCTSSEMGHLFYNELGGMLGSPNLALFQNAQHNGPYWSDSVGNSNFAQDVFAWGFNLFRGGYQDSFLKSSVLVALAVRSGDVPAVPVPAAAWLFGSGLIGLTGIARKHKAA